jgi:aldehyde dehydrogenase
VATTALFPEAASSPFKRTTYSHFIGGEWVEGTSGKVIEQRNPATGELIATIAAGNAQDVDRAVRAAHAALPKWSASSADQRQALLNEIARRLRARVADYAMMESLNNGKTIVEATVHDVPFAAEIFSYFAGSAHLLLEGGLKDFGGTINLVHREPIGVCAQIIPWNVPLLMAAAKIAPAIVSGNTVVLKPAETVCLSVLEFLEEMADILPAGVVNVVTGYGQVVGEPLVTHPLVRKVAFTGSVLTGKKIVEYASRNLIPQTLELGGKSAHIICASADVDAAVEAAAMSTVFSKGEVCVAGTRLFVHNSLREEVSAKLVELLNSIRFGSPQNLSTQMGAQASELQYKKILGYLDLCGKDGTRVLCGGEAATVPGFEKGFFIKPTLLDNISNDMRLAREEIFGPVTCLLSWSDEDDLMRQVNDSDYGLASGIWTRDLAQAHRLSRRIQAGIVWINRYYNFRAGMPMGGYKQSGFGREMSREVLDAYTLTKSVAINLDEGKLGVFEH